MLIIDNSFYCYGLNPENGIPILPYLGKDKKDTELKKLCKFLLENFTGENSENQNVGDFVKNYFLSGFDIQEEGVDSYKIATSLAKKLRDISDKITINNERKGC